MTRYKVCVVLTCPSNWVEDSVRQYVERFAITSEERATIKITSLQPQPNILIVEATKSHPAVYKTPTGKLACSPTYEPDADWGDR